MERTEAEWALEREHLARTIAVAGAQFDALAQRSKKRAEEIQAAQEEMLERTAYDLGGLSSAQGFEELMELTQMMDPVRGAASAQKTDDEKMRVLAYMMKKPYFARVDFRREGESEARELYIGRATLMEESPLLFHVYDWRTPIASVFYRYGVGPASYEAPAGTVSGDVLCKRQYEIQNGELRFFFDADVQVTDAFLRELLSRPASGAMKSIVETIQRDQDMVIRDMESDLLMVQGSAGSGKTAVALHRVAYLMYQGLSKRQLSARDILILSPNAVFERYISRVLPELGESHVKTALFEELFQRLLPDVSVQPRGAWAEAWLSCEDPRAKDIMRRARAFKGSRAFMALLDRFVYELPRRFIPFQDAFYAETCVADKNLMRAEICNSKKLAPLGTRVTWLERAIFERVHALRAARLEKLQSFAARFPAHALEAAEYARMLSIHEHGRLLRQIRAFTRVDCLSLYRALFQDAEAFARLSAGILPREEAEEIRLHTLRELASDALPYGDAAALAYLTARVHGARSYAHMRQVVLDEAQDADALHIAILRLLFPNARFTILGDIHQTIAGAANLSLYEDIRESLGGKHSTLVTMDKSFRCTKEIWDFSTQFLPEGAAGQCFSRSGEPPHVYASPDEAAGDAALTQSAQECRTRGHQSVALICKTEKEALLLHARLQSRMDVRLVREDGMLDTDGIFVIPLYVAKGLEFDAVLVCGVDTARYRDEEDRTLLYVACTRALHWLGLFYAGERSPLLPPEGREDI